ncbi:hypothetical protein D3C71_2150430 [compost metagenome]
MFENHIGRYHALERGDRRQAFAKHAGSRALDDDDNLAALVAVDLDIFHARQGGKDSILHRWKSDDDCT